MQNNNNRNSTINNQGKLRICVGASAGGHMNQLLRLLEVCESWSQQPSFYVTTVEALAGKLRQKGPVYIIGECNRKHPLIALRVLLRSLKIAIKEHPDVVITTGSLPLAILCLSAKVFGAKIVWIDSIANVERFSMSGQLIRHFAALFLTQWPDLVKNRKNVEYVGAIV